MTGKEMNTRNCPVCGLESQRGVEIGPLGSEIRIDCQRCGKYKITNTALSMLDTKRTDPMLIAWIKDLNEKGADPPIIDSYVLKNLTKGLPNYSPSQKQLILMRNLEKRTEYPGKSVHVMPEFDYPLSWASGEEELRFYLRNLVERGLLHLPSKEHAEINDLINIVGITPAGWDYLEENSKLSVFSDQAFVAMSFSENLHNIWKDAIKKGIERAGYKAYRVDSDPHSDRIDVKIITEIKNSKFLLADVTEQKRGVYFEAGYALGLGIPVIWACRKDDLKNVHFDTRQYNHILWEDGEDYTEKLYNFICAIIGKLS